jgi:hypothetical protein
MARITGARTRAGPVSVTDMLVRIGEFLEKEIGAAN